MSRIFFRVFSIIGAADQVKRETSGIATHTGLLSDGNRV